MLSIPPPLPDALHKIDKELLLRYDCDVKAHRKKLSLFGSIYFLPPTFLASSSLKEVYSKFGNRFLEDFLLVLFG